MTKFITFHEWIEKQKNKKSPLGALAGDLLKDPGFPKDVASADALLAYLKSKQVSGATIATARIAWKTYSREHGAGPRL
jgi:uncharacterized protein YozE (UPF0346 family)